MAARVAGSNDAQIGGAWATVLVGGLGRGGQGIYALDVTKPSLFTESNAANIVLWEFNDTDDADLGYVYGKPLIRNVTSDDIARALDTASKIGDDYIQKNLGGGRVDTSKFTHGTSAQREKWFRTGLDRGDPAACNTFDTNNLG